VASKISIVARQTDLANTASIFPSYQKREFSPASMLCARLRQAALQIGFLQSS